MIFLHVLLGSGLAYSHGHLPLVTELLPGKRQLLLCKVRELESLNDGPLAVLDRDGEAKHDADRGVVTSVREHAHADPVIVRCAAEPGLHVIRSGLWCRVDIAATNFLQKTLSYLGRRHSAAQLPSRDDSSPSLLNSGNKLCLKPSLVQADGLLIAGGLAGVRELGAGVIPPDGHLPDGGDGLAQLGGQLCGGPVLVQSTSDTDLVF